MKKFLVLSLLCLLSVTVFIAVYPAITARAAEDYPPPPPLSFTVTLPVLATLSSSIKIPPPKGPISIPQSTFNFPALTVGPHPRSVREVPGYVYIIFLCILAIIIFGSVYYLFLRQSRKWVRLITR
jgi:hypothetical protein